MNFLQICQAITMECDVALTGPSTTASQTGRLGQIVTWAIRSWVDLQTRRNDWRFMIGDFTVQTTAGDRKYAYGDCTDVAAAAPITAFRDWCKDSLRVYRTSGGQGSETELTFIDYRDWHRAYNIGTSAVSTTRSYPRTFTVDNDMALLLGEYPDAAYTISGRYMKKATELSGDSDEPELPSEYHMAIVYRAMMKYGRYVGAPEVYNDGQREYARMLTEIIRTQTLPPRVPGPLVR